jgi:transposase-like protein
MKRQHIAEILLRHRGSVSEVAREINVTKQSVSQWLSGRMDSKRIGEACKAKAEQLLVQEATERRESRSFGARGVNRNGDKS